MSIDKVENFEDILLLVGELKREMSLLSVSEDSLCPSFQKYKHKLSNADGCFSNSDINSLYITDKNPPRNKTAMSKIFFTSICSSKTKLITFFLTKFQ